MTTVSCVVVHHKSPGTLPLTIEALVSAGIDRQNLVVVDNSEDAEVADEIRSSLDPRSKIHFTRNRGYAAAVNYGVELVRSHSLEFVLVSTHEVLPQRHAVESLLEAMLKDPSIGVAGPTLVNQDPSKPRVWSTGGLLRPLSGLPRHSAEAPPAASEPLERVWLDGAFCLYRLEALNEQIREDFFLYTEELEFHVRLRALGWKVVWVPGATASQSTNGTPPFLQARNLQIFLRLWGNPWQQALSVPMMIARESITRVVKRRSPLRALPQLVRGWRQGRSHPLDSSTT